MKKYFWPITCILFIAAALSACSSETFPMGAYSLGSHTMEFHEDGTLRYLISDNLMTESSYSIQDDQITITGYSDCDEPATYIWQYDDHRLTFEPTAEDPCRDRSNSLSMNWLGPE